MKFEQIKGVQGGVLAVELHGGSNYQQPGTHVFNFFVRQNYKASTNGCNTMARLCLGVVAVKGTFVPIPKIVNTGFA